MAIFSNKPQYDGFMNPFYVEPAKKDVMGYKLVGVADGSLIPQGYPLYCDEDNKTAHLCRYASVLAVESDKKTLKVKKGHLLTTSDKVVVSGKNTLLNISSIDDSNRGYDVVVLSAQNNDIKAGGALVVAVAGAEGAAPEYLPNRVVSDKKKVDELDHTISAVHSVVILQNVVGYPAEFLNVTAFPGTTLLVGCPYIQFIKQ